jgi:hypothetical protein
MRRALHDGQQAAAFAGKGNQMLMAAVATFDPQEPLFEPATAKVVLELRLHEAGQ